jgi:hypothetical protein
MNNGKQTVGYEKLVSIEMNDNLIESTNKLSAMNRLRNGTKETLKYASLVTLTVQNAALTLTMRAARTQNDLFISSTAVIIAEVLKLLTCLVMVFIDEGLYRLINLCFN